MKTLTSKALSLLILLLIGLTINLSAQTVYTTKSGKKYHNSDCRYLDQSKIKTTVSEAILDGYTACKVCKPPTKATTKTEASVEKTEEPINSDSNQVTSKESNTKTVQCSGITKSGSRCKRKTSDPSGKCWQHRDD